MIESSARKRTFAWGTGAVILYLVAALMPRGGWQEGVRPLYDGLAPPAPYRFVKPPPSLTANNEPPLSGRGTLRLLPDGSESLTLATDDGQATVTFERGSIRPRSGETSVRITIRPRDPGIFGAPPKGLNYDGNAYAVNATYAISGAPVVLASQSCPKNPAATQLCPTIILRYAFKATDLYRRAGSTWASLDATPLPGALSIFADSPALGVFVAVGHTAVAQPTSGRVYLVVLLATAALAAVLGFGRRAQLRRARARRSTRKRRR